MSANDKYDFPYNTSAGPLEYLDASITNLFYHNNLIHDFLYAAGFDEARCVISLYVTELIGTILLAI